MIEKEKLIVCLNDFGIQFNCEVSISGMIQEFMMCIVELEEELDGDVSLIDGENGEKNVFDSIDSIDSIDSDVDGMEKVKIEVVIMDDWVLVEMLVILYINVFYVMCNEFVFIVEFGVVICVIDVEVNDLIFWVLVWEI